MTFYNSNKNKFSYCVGLW